MNLAKVGEPQGGNFFSFDWMDFLKLSFPKLALVLIIPAIVALVATGKPGTILDFYDYLLKPRMGVWTGTEIEFVFNRFILLWIPFYLAACTLIHLRKRKGHAG